MTQVLESVFLRARERRVRAGLFAVLCCVVLVVKVMVFHWRAEAMTQVGRRRRAADRESSGNLRKLRQWFGRYQGEGRIHYSTPVHWAISVWTSVAKPKLLFNFKNNRCEVSTTLL